MPLDNVYDEYGDLTTEKGRYSSAREEQTARASANEAGLRRLMRGTGAAGEPVFGNNAATPAQTAISNEKRRGISNSLGAGIGRAYGAAINLTSAGIKAASDAASNFASGFGEGSGRGSSGTPLTPAAAATPPLAQAAPLTPAPIKESVGAFGERAFSGQPPVTTAKQPRYVHENGRFRLNEGVSLSEGFGPGLNVADSPPVSLTAIQGTSPGTGQFSAVAPDTFNQLAGFDAYKDSEGKLTSPAIREAEMAALRRGESLTLQGPKFMTFGEYGDGSGSTVSRSAMQSPMEREFGSLRSRLDSGDIGRREATLRANMIKAKYEQQNEMEQLGFAEDADMRNAQQTAMADAFARENPSFAERTARFKAERLAERQRAQTKNDLARLALDQGGLVQRTLENIRASTVGGDTATAAAGLATLRMQAPDIYKQVVASSPAYLKIAAMSGDKDAVEAFARTF